MSDSDSAVKGNNRREDQNFHKIFSNNNAVLEPVKFNDHLASSPCTLNRSWQSNKGTFRDSGMAGIEPMPSQSQLEKDVNKVATKQHKEKQYFKREKYRYSKYNRR
jgi:hypothetical protein